MIASKLSRGVALVWVVLATGCGALDVSDPTAIEEEDLASPEGADLLRRHALGHLYEAASRGARNGGVFADEFFALPSRSYIGSDLVWAEHALDQRRSALMEEEWASFGGYPFVPLQETRIAAINAEAWYRTYGAAAHRAYIGQMLAVRGYATLTLAEQICPGFALHGVEDGRPAFGTPLTTEEAFEEALADFDSALVYATDSVAILNLARTGRARALLGLGRFADAGVAAADVPTVFVWNAEYGVGYPADPNQLWLRLLSTSNLSVADSEGGNGLDFIAADDPRVRVSSLGMGHDGVTELYRADKYSEGEAPMVLASGLEARLIEAEAALQSGGDWLGILNALRTTCADAATCADPAPAGSGGIDGLPPLTDPGTDAARVDLLFRERAFWLFATGHRLGDLRRLVHHYGRDAETVFPTGAYYLGGVYDVATSIPFAPAGEEVAQSGVTGCTGW